MYENVIDVLKAIEAGVISSIEGEEILKNLNSEAIKVKRKPPSGIKQFLSKNLVNNDSLNFIDSLDYLGTMILFLKKREMVRERDNSDLYILLESAELPEIVSAIGLLRGYLPTVRSVKGSHDLYIKALMGEFILKDKEALDPPDDDDFFEEDLTEDKELVYQ